MKYREIEFSVADNRDGTWRWQVHHKLTPAGQPPKLSGPGPNGEGASHTEAVSAAHTAIDQFLAG